MTWRIRLAPPPGAYKVSAWKGKRVKLLRDLGTGAAVWPAGTRAVVDETPAGTGLSLLGDPCRCCGVRLRARRVLGEDVEVVGSCEPDPAPTCTWTKQDFEGDNFETSCGHAFMTLYGSESDVGASIRYCCFCGKEIFLGQYPDPDQED